MNLQQGMKTGYDAKGFTLAAMETPGQPMGGSAYRKKKSNHHKTDDWQLALSLSGLYADGALVCAPDKEAAHTADTSDLCYIHHGLLTVQYQNTEEGVRQNFIVAKAPAANAAELRVKLQASAGWVVNKAGDRELHFAQRSAKGSLSTKVIYKDLKVWDAAGMALPARLSADGNGISIIVASAGAKYPVAIDPLATTATATLTGTAGSFFGNSVAPAGDVNGDGYSDVIVGAYGLSSNTGAAYVYLGSSTGLSSTAATTLNGTAGSYFGYCAASAGGCERGWIQRCHRRGLWCFFRYRCGLCVPWVVHRFVCYSSHFLKRNCSW